jgi:hypothetical protein
MRVGVHEAIHGAGLSPNTMNSGAQTMATLCGAIYGL